MSGDATINSSGALTLASTITAAGPVGGATSIPVITYDAKGRLTTVTTATPTVTSVNSVSYPSSYNSGGIPYASASGTIASSAAWTANRLMKGGGAGASPVVTGITVDSANSISGFTLFTGGGTYTGTYANYIDMSGSNSAPAMNFILNNGVTTGSFVPSMLNLFGTNDIFFSLNPPTSAGYGIIESYLSAGLALSTGPSSNITLRPNRSTVATAFAGGGFSVGTTSDPGAGMIYTNAATFMIRTKTSYTNGAGAGAGTIANAPSAGNPTKWIPIDDNGTTRYIPAW